MRIGVLALQGAFIEHIHMLNKLGVSSQEIRKTEDLKYSFDGLIFPGGESSAIGKLLKDLELFLPLNELICQGIPVFGTCAGMILLASKIKSEPVIHFGTMNICVVRNAYGKQLNSFNIKSGFADNQEIEMPFIRAPYIDTVGRDVEILSIVDNKVVAVRQNNQLATAFHPELTKNDCVHKYFLNMIKNRERSL